MMKVGILGGGQLGRMLLQAAANYPVEVYVMESSEDCPAAHLCYSFTKGDIQNADDVFEFGKDLDAITIEIEAVSVEGLKKLREHGVRVFPSPEALEIIKNKIRQKEFYHSNGIPTSEFVITSKKEDVKKYPELFPAVHKAATGGYDGRGVQILNAIEDWELAFDTDAELERKVDIHKEVAVIVAKNESGKTAVFPATEMVFDPQLNLLSYQLSPADLSEKTHEEAQQIALSVVNHLNSPGIFAVELFVDKAHKVWVNETAPRVHNSGHDTIEGNFSSQFDMLWRVILQFPLGNTAKIKSTALINLIGQNTNPISEKNKAFTDMLKMDNAFVHLYGKKDNRPGRKMGHVTILDNGHHNLVNQAEKINQLWKNES